MIRYSLLALVVFFLMVYAWKDWYKSLCGLILFMAVIERPDMPRTMLGIPGLNVWNIMLVNVVLAWLASRRREGLSWDMPRHVNVLILCYLAVVLVSILRMLADRASLDSYSTGDLLSNFFLNTLKWPIPGLLLYDGCRTRGRFYLGLACILGTYFLLAVQCARVVPPSGDLGELERRSRENLEKRIGYHRVDLATMLAGASWAAFASRVLGPRAVRALALGASGLTFYALALTAGRAGYVAWVGVGLVLLSLRWRRYLLLAPIAVLAVTLAVPAVVDRMMFGFRGDDRLVGEDAIDEEEVTAGRTDIWPHVIAKILEAPVFGYGREAMLRTGLAAFGRDELGDKFGHPHNAYLELLLDSGFLGFTLVMPFYAVCLFHALRLYRDSRSPVFVAAGGTAAALVLAWMAGAIGAQTFYPREGNVPMWCAVGSMLRVSVERRRSLAQGRRSSNGARIAVASPLERELAHTTITESRPPGSPRRLRKRQNDGDSVDGRLWRRGR